jgi:Domain of unknown function (DUF4234)/Protein of unknown function (DUF2510)
LSAQAAALTRPAASTSRRDPVVVGVLSLITIGLYAIYWWYQVARELRDLGREKDKDLGQEPAMSALAFSVGALIIVPSFVTVFATCRRVQEAQELGHTPTTLNTWIAGGLYVGSYFTLGLSFPVFCAYVQSQMNTMWDTQLTASSDAPSSDAPQQPDWYPDPTGQARLRYWDGRIWTEHTAD